MKSEDVRKKLVAAADAYERMADKIDPPPRNRSDPPLFLPVGSGPFFAISRRARMRVPPP